ncbi:MAG: hypothetical protein ABEJ65_10840, partial [bacterium]
ENSQLNRLEHYLKENGILQNGRVTKPTGSISTEDREEIESIVGYLTYEHGLDSLYPWLTPKQRHKLRRTRDQSHYERRDVAMAVLRVSDPKYETDQEFSRAVADELKLVIADRFARSLAGGGISVHLNHSAPGKRLKYDRVLPGGDTVNIYVRMERSGLITIDSERWGNLKFDTNSIDSVIRSQLPQEDEWEEVELHPDVLTIKPRNNRERFRLRFRELELETYKQKYRYNEVKVTLIVEK